MKQSVKTIVEAIEKEIRIILDNSDKIESYRLEQEKEFDYGIIHFEIETNDDWDVWEEQRNDKVLFRINSVTVTNENSKTLTNLSNEVFNQLELTYTNY